MDVMLDKAGAKPGHEIRIRVRIADEDSQLVLRSTQSLG